MKIEPKGKKYIVELTAEEVIGLRVDFIDVLLNRKDMRDAKFTEKLYNTLCEVEA